MSATESSTAGHDRGAARVFGGVPESVNEVVVRGAWPRLKTCCRHPYLHCFVDRTKNDSQRCCGSQRTSRTAMRAT